MNKKIAVLVGSTRKDSYSQTLAHNMAELFPADYQVDFVKIGHLPIYNQDYDKANTPEEYESFRAQIRDVDGVMFVTPEHNRSFSAVLKNAIDIGSRPYGHSVWDGKPALVVSQSPGNISGFGANHHLRQVLTFLNMPVLQQPEAYIAHTNKLFDEEGKVNNEGTLEFLQTVVDAFVELIGIYEKEPSDKTF